MTVSHPTPTDAGPGERPLWAPWRIEYIRSPDRDECFLCRKGATAPTVQAEADLENHVIGRGERCFVLLNEFPYNSGHLLVVPYRHVPDLGDLFADELTEIMALTVRAKQVLQRLMAPEGFNVGFNLGTAAGAGLREHVHGHLVPRWNGDTNFMPVLGNPRVVPEALAATARLLRQAWD